MPRPPTGPIPVALRQAVADGAVTAAATVRRYLEGKNVSRSSRVRIAGALVALGRGDLVRPDPSATPAPLASQDPRSVAA